MPPAVGTGNHIFLAQPQAGSGKNYVQNAVRDPTQREREQYLSAACTFLTLSLFVAQQEIAIRDYHPYSSPQHPIGMS